MSTPETETAPPEPEPKLCRECHGWGTVEVCSVGGHRRTEDCRHCAGSGEEL